jgi:oxalate---CoA ligase
MSVSFLAPLAKCNGIRDVATGLRWDASALNEQIIRRASLLLKAGIKQGSVVAIGHGGSAHFFADLFACWLIGATAACLDPSLTPDEIQNVINFANAAALLVHGQQAIAGIRIPLLNLDIQRSGDVSPFPAPAAAPLDAPALMLFTSGTTGTPKGVVLSFRALLARIELNIEAIGRAPLAKALVSLPTHFGHGLIGNSLTPLFAGGEIVLHPLGIPLANDLGRVIDEHGITFMSSVPSFWRLVLGRSRQPILGSLLKVHVGSAPFPASLWSEVAAWSNAEVVNCYGATETANWISGASSRSDGIADGLVGKMWGGRAAVLDDNGVVQREGVGELLIRSPSLMTGYLDRPDLTAQALFQGWYRTGDRGSIDARGSLTLAGRLKDEINRAGFKVQPAELDTLLERNPAVSEACVFGIADPLGGEAVAAAIRLNAGSSATAAELEAWCRERLRREAVPEKWFFVSEIPRTARGKVSRDAVRRSLHENASIGVHHQTAQLSPKVIDDEHRIDLIDLSALKTSVEHAWKAVLGRGSYEAGVRLPETEADSLDVMRFWLLIEKHLGVHLSMDVLDAGPTPDQLTDLLTKQLQERLDFDTSHTLDLPTVFLTLPAGGDLPDLARFRAALKRHVKFVLIQYPDWRDMIKNGSGFDALVNHSIAQICAHRKQDDSILLAGYSYGGLVAAEVARRLLEQGRKVDFVGLIDTRAINPQSIVKRLRRFLTPRHTSKGTAPSHAPTTFGRTTTTPSRWQALISALIIARAFRVLKLVGALEMRLPEKQAFILNNAINWRLRTEALRRLRLGPFNFGLTLFRSEDPQSSQDYGWGAQCRNLTVIPVGGSHETMMSEPFLEELCAQFKNAVHSSSIA